MEHRCPEHIVRMFDGDESSKKRGRAEAIAWLVATQPDIGDIVWIPHPETGVLESFVKGPVAN